MSYVYKSSKETGVKKYIANTLLNLESGSSKPMEINGMVFVIHKTPYLITINERTFKKVSEAVEYIYYTAHNKPAS